MSPTNPDSVNAVRPELTPGETILWAGQPKTSIVFHKQDALLIPFSLLWGGFSIFWEAAVSGHPLWGASNHTNGPWPFGMVWGIPFVLIGQYLIWGRFLYVAWRKKVTHYAVTNLRVIAAQMKWPRRITSAYIESLPTLIKEAGSRGIGTLRFTTQSERRRWGAWNIMDPDGLPSFIDIEDADALYKMILNLRPKGQGYKQSFSFE